MRRSPGCRRGRASGPGWSLRVGGKAAFPSRTSYVARNTVIRTAGSSRVVQSDHWAAHGRKERVRNLSSMKVAIHQPCFLPWLGYLDRMARSDLFILLDHV